MDSEDVGKIVGIVAVIVVIVLIYYFVIKPTIYDLTLWWYSGNGPWFLIGMLVGGIILAIIAVYAATR